MHRRRIPRLQSNRLTLGAERVRLGVIRHLHQLGRSIAYPERKRLTLRSRTEHLSRGLGQDPAHPRANLLIRQLPRAQRSQRRQRLHLQHALRIQRQHPRQTHHPTPARGRHRGLTALLRNPPPKYPPSLGIELRLRSIERAPVQLTFLQRPKHHRRLIHHARLPEDFPQRRVNQHMPAIQRKELWTLPHLAIVAGVRRLLPIPLAARERMQVLPLLQFRAYLAAVQQHAPAHIFHARPHRQVVPIALPPHRRITETRNLHPDWRPRHHRLRVLRPGHQPRVIAPS